MSEITNHGLTWSSWHGMLYSCTQYGNSGRQGVNRQVRFQFIFFANIMKIVRKTQENWQRYSYRHCCTITLLLSQFYCDFVNSCSIVVRMGRARKDREKLLMAVTSLPEGVQVSK